MKFRWQLALAILVSLSLNSLINILLAHYQQIQLLDNSQQTLSQTLLHGNTLNNLLANGISTVIILCIAYFFIRKMTTPVTRNADSNDSNQGLIDNKGEGVAIHKRKIAEQELRESTQHLKVYRDQSPLAIIEWRFANASGDITDWNKASENMLGYNFAEVEGKTPDFLSPEG